MHHTYAGPAPAAEADSLSLSESTYELINTDGETESQDDRAPESLDGDLDFLCRPDDMTSLASTDHTNDDDSQDSGDSGHEEEVDDTVKVLSDQIPQPTATMYTNECGQEPLLQYLARNHADRVLGGPSSRNTEFDDHDLLSTLRSRQSVPGSSSAIGAPTESRGVCRWPPPKVVKAEASAPRLDQDDSPKRSGILENVNIALVIRRACLAVGLVLFPMVLSTLIRALGEQTKSVIQAPAHTTHIHIASTTTVSIPTTVTVTITSTKTIQPNLLQDLAQKFGKSAEDAARAVEDTCIPAILSVASRIREDTASATDSIKSMGQVAQDFSGETVDRLKNSLSDRVAKFRQEAQEKLAHQVRAARDLGEDMGFAMLKAQIGSRLMWLKARGDVAEFTRYRAKAAEFLKTKNRQLMTKRAQRDGGPSRRFSLGRTLRWRAAP